VATARVAEAAAMARAEEAEAKACDALICFGDLQQAVGPAREHPVL